MKFLKKLVRNIVVIALLVAVVFGFDAFSKSALPKVEADGYQIKFGSIHGSDLIEAGFEIPFSQKFAAKTWDDGIALKKDGKTLAYLTMFNVGSESRDVENCKVGELLINSECDPVLTVNGEKLIGADRATACKVLDLEDNNEDSISKSRGDYGLYVLFYEDKVSSIKLTYDFGKSY